MNKTKEHKANNSSSTISGNYSRLKKLLSSASSIDEFRQQVLSIINNLGFSDFIFMRIDRDWTKISDYGLLYSVPKDLMRAYHEEQMYTLDLIMLYAKSNVQPIFASQLYNHLSNAPFEIELTHKNRMLQQFYKRFHYHDLYVIPMKASNKSGNVQLAILNKNTSADAFQTQISPAISSLRNLCKAIDSVSTITFQNQFIEKQSAATSLSPKQLEAITMLANNDISISALSRLLDICPVTAHQHIAGVRKALGVSTNIAAIKKLVKLGVIKY